MTRIEKYYKNLVALEKHLRKGDATARQLAKRFKVSVPTIHARLRRLSITSFATYVGPRKTGPVPKMWGLP